MVGGYSLVFSGSVAFSSDVKFGANIGSFIVYDSEMLSKNYIVYQSNIDVSKAYVKSLCDIESKFIDKEWKYYIFEVNYTNTSKCASKNTILALWDIKYPNTHNNTGKTFQKNEYFSYLLDLDTPTLKSLLPELKADLEKYALYRNFQGEISMKYLKYVFGQRKFLEAEYKLKIITEILEARTKKYILPIVGSKLSESFTKIPNSPRPYRSAYTDGIHHAWDIDGKFRDEIVALDSGVIVRIVADFEQKDFDRIVYSDNGDEHRKTKNLDILRGKQVWLKTMKWDVVFYSHLDEIYDDIQEWMKIEKWHKIGRTGVTGVPEEGYDDYHLHFSVMKNPYTLKMWEKYDFGDYMQWDWYTKWMSHQEVITEQKKIFEY